ncbi:MAG: hypothetical protein ACRDYA_03650 [Egibacteraceae bacterium]
MPVIRLLRAALSVLVCAFVLTAPASAYAAVVPVPGDPLPGSGAVTRSLLTAADLNSGTSNAPVDDGAFALPEAAAPPTHTFEGRLTLTDEHDPTRGGFTELRDDYLYTGRDPSPRKHLPETAIDFVQNGSHLIPVTQGLSITGHDYWNLIVGPGRIWREDGDGGASRAAFPFALVERNANCTHNGAMTFLYNGVAVSQVRYQITQETCLYFKFDMYGQLPATYTPASISGAEAAKNARAAEVADQLPTKPIPSLAVDYPEVDVAAFGAGLTPAHITSYGLYYGEVNYVSGCPTRYGSYAFCGAMRLPSYSTAKTAFASVAEMRLAQKYGTGVGSQLIRTHVLEYATAPGNWTNVTIDHALDMATGNYRFATFMTDENEDEVGEVQWDFFLAEPYGTKIAMAFGYQPRVAPGTRWVYHTSDTFIATRAMDNYLRSQEDTSADVFAMLRDEVFTPIRLSSGAMTSLRTDNSPTGAPFGGYGLFWTTDDLAKVARLLNNDGGAAGGTQLLHPALLADAMQRDPSDRGLVTPGPTPFRYNNGVWALEVTPAEYPQYSCTFYVPFMSGFGGITVAMMPNGATYYYVSDNNEFLWIDAVNQADRLSPHCASVGGAASDDALRRTQGAQGGAW